MIELTGYLSGRRYPGRGVLFGIVPGGAYAAASYFIMGRSSNSRNRVFEKTEDGAMARAYDAKLVSDPSLILYAPVRFCGGALVVTNGDQTDTICSYLNNGGSFRSALLTRRYEPDAPHFTPRISGILRVQNGRAHYTLSILRKAPAAMDCLRDFYEYADCPAGTGHFIHTYEEGPDPLRTFAGEPRPVLLPEGPIGRFAETLWNSLDPENRISLYVCFLPLDGGEPRTELRNARDK
ncbi:MAG TPA: IMP cyclohydrolase [Feifaniaceae bacterium]|nr:IMP cyclohydrolase [Feifaniaceae bacterium]